MEENTFKGFSKETVNFFNDLKENNSKEWFNQNREVYDNAVISAARTFVVAMGERLHGISEDIVANPKTDKSIFRIHRDTRFSKNKAPYKTHQGIFFWEGDGKKLECSGFYFHIEPPKLMLGVGLHVFPKPFIAPYREAVANEKQGKKLRDILTAVEAKNYSYGGSHYKRVPRGYDPDHPNADLLKHNGLFGSIETEIPEVFYTDSLVDYCFNIFNDLAPLHHWLLNVTQSL
jgi:uncharacterized protein (TIGR02453 family)